MALDRRFLNVILLGFGFMFVFTAFQTMGNIEVSEQYFPFELFLADVTMNGFSTLWIDHLTYSKLSNDVKIILNIL